MELDLTIEEKLKELESEKENLEVFIECAEVYSECQRLVKRYVSEAKNGVSTFTRWSLNAVTDLKIKYRELSGLVKQSKEIDKDFNFKELMEKLDIIKNDYRDIEKEIKELRKKQYPLNVNELELEINDALPKEMLFGVQDEKPVFLYLYDNGNICVRHKLIDFDDTIEKFIFAFVMKVFKSFPLNSVSIMLVDPERKYKKSYILVNSFIECKNAIEYFDNYDDLFNSLDNEIKDMCSKFNSAHPDFYSIYQDDQTKRIKYVICLSGINKILNESSYHSNIAKTYELFDNHGSYFRCGVRTLCFVEPKKEEQHSYENNGEKFKRIFNYCEKIFFYDKGEFSYNNDELKVLNINERYVDAYVESFAKEYTELANGNKTKNLSYEEVGFGTARGSADESYISIPVGKTGDKVVELTFNCGSQGTTYKDQIMGYLLTGQTGSGKSSLIHSFIMNGCMKYSPEELELWLVDFKSNAMASRYIKSNIPHITRIAKNSSSEDLYMMLKELEGIVDYRFRHGFMVEENGLQVLHTDLVRYNSAVLARGDDKYRVLPRIILIIDEMQDVFLNSTAVDDLKKGIKTLIANIVNKGRAAGVHLFIISQSGEDNKVGELSQFVNQSVGEILFKQTMITNFYKKIVKEAGDMISKLDRGHFMLCMGEDSLVEARSAYIDDSDQELLHSYFAKIIEKYPRKACQLEIGDSTPLTMQTVSKIYEKPFFDLVTHNSRKDTFVIGENFISLQNEEMSFKQEPNQNAYIVGQNNLMSQSILSSLFIQTVLSHQKVYALDNDRRKECPFSVLLLNADNTNIKKVNLNNLCLELYPELLKREEAKNNEVGFDNTEFEPLFVFINALDYLTDQLLENNISFSETKDENNKPVKKSDYSFLDKKESGSMDDILSAFNKNLGTFDEKHKNDIAAAKIEQTNIKASSELVIRDTKAKDILKRLLADGSKVSIFFIVSANTLNIKFPIGNYAVASKNSVFFNTLDYSSQLTGFNDSGLAKSTLKKIDESDLNESLAFSRIYLQGHKFRPLLYTEDQFNTLIDVLKGGN